VDPAVGSLPASQQGYLVPRGTTFRGIKPSVPSPITDTDPLGGRSFLIWWRGRTMVRWRTLLNIIALVSVPLTGNFEGFV
jgi:hypothetical protein